MPLKPNHPSVLKSAKKPSLVLVHGFRGAPIGLAKIADTLTSAGYDVHVPAIPPFAGSGDLATYTPQAYANFLANYIEQNRLDHPILIGHSMGSIIVAATLQYHKNLLNRRAILLSPIAKRTATPLRIISPLSAILPRHLIDNITTLYLFIPKDKNLRREALAITHACSNDHPPRKKQVFRAAQFSTRYSISDFHLTQDVLIVAGEKDRIMSQKNIKSLANQLQAELQILPNSGHLHNYEKPTETADAILNFLHKN